MPSHRPLGLRLATRALAPMREAAARAHAAGAGAERLQLPVRGLGDEWDELAAVMNELLAHQHRSIARQDAARGARFVLELPAEAPAGERPRSSGVRPVAVAPRPPPY